MDVPARERSSNRKFNDVDTFTVKNDFIPNIIMMLSDWMLNNDTM